MKPNFWTFLKNFFHIHDWYCLPGETDVCEPSQRNRVCEKCHVVQLNNDRMMAEHRTKRAEMHKLLVEARKRAELLETPSGSMSLYEEDNEGRMSSVWIGPVDS